MGIPGTDHPDPLTGTETDDGRRRFAAVYPKREYLVDRALFYRYTPGHMAFVGRYREDGLEHPGGAYPQPSHTDADDWTPLERRMLEPPYAWERPATVTE